MVEILSSVLPFVNSALIILAGLSVLRHRRGRDDIRPALRPTRPGRGLPHW